MTKVAIIILNWNGREYLEKFLPILLEHSQLPETEIIIADNLSTDESLVFLKTNYPVLRVIALEQNYGFAGGYNRALEQVEASYYLLLNSDVEVTSGWLQPLVSFLDSNENVAACSPIIADYHTREKYEYAGAAGGYIDKFGYAFCRGRLFDILENTGNNPSYPVSVFWTTGACMLIRSRLFNEAGGFDAEFFAHMEEIDLCWRLKNRGYSLAVVPGSVVYHVGGGTLPKSNPLKTYLNFRNNLYLLSKNLPGKIAAPVLFQRLIFDGISALRFLLRGDYADFKAVFKAHGSFYKRRKILKVYRNNQSKYNITGWQHPEIYHKSVVADFFIYKNRTFHEIRDGFGARMDNNTIE